mmetsp:Transcript_8750/g.14555  ORF Transcript_8750/g.14555 Transcript_8750/m.14555 type:complete len:229 (+) Transcript_8750:443-1129(+)
MHELRRISLVLVCVVELRVVHADNRSSLFEVVTKLLAPLPVRQASGTLVAQLVDHINVMHQVHDKGFHLQLHEGLAGQIMRSKLTECVLQLVVQSIQSIHAFLHGRLTVIGELDILRQTKNLRGVVPVEFLGFQAAVQQGGEGGTHLLGELLQPVLHLLIDRHRRLERDHLVGIGNHCRDGLHVFAEFDFVDSLEQFLQMRLDDVRVLGLTQDLQQIIVTNEVESRHG